MLPPLSALLDVREVQGRVSPAGSAWIPLSQLSSRVSELPAPGRSILIADTGPEAAEAAEWLNCHGRWAELAQITNWSTPKSFRLWSPNEFLEQWINDRPPGNAVDLGCGGGRDAVSLAALGWRVLAVDRLEEALEKTKNLAEVYGVRDLIELRTGSAGSVDTNGADLVLMFFLFDTAALEVVNHTLKRGATFLLETFTETHREHLGKPSPTNLVTESLVRTSMPDLKIVSYDEDWRSSGRHTGRLIAEGTRDLP